MKSLATQFGNNRLSSAVATPTCSSCCCCCCCLATVITSSSLLGQKVDKEAGKLNKPNRILLAIVGYFYLIIAGLLTAASAFAVDKLFKSCITHTIPSASSNIDNSYTYQTCNNPGIWSVIPLLILFIFLLIWMLYRSVDIKPAAGRAILVTVLICIAFSAEFFGGAMLILTGIGAFIYVALVPIVIGWLSVWYRKHLIKETISTPGTSFSSSDNYSATSTTDYSSPSAPVSPSASSVDEYDLKD